MLSRYFTPRVVRSLKHTLRFSPFSSIPNINFNDFTRIYRRQTRNEEYEYVIQDSANKVSFSIPEESTVKDLKSKLQEFSKDIKSVQALSIDLAEYADITKLTDLANESHYLILNNQNLCKVKSTDLGEADKFDLAYRKREEINQNIGLPFIEQQIILSYLKRVDVLNSEVLGKNLFADADVYEGKVDKKLVIKNLLDAVIGDKNHSINDEEQLIGQYVQMKDRLDQLKIQHELLERKAHVLTKRKMFLGLFALIGQFSFVGVGTYVVYSWDIMEPMAYFLGLIGAIGISGLYFKTYSDYSHQGFLRHLKERELRKLYVKHGFPKDEMLQLEETLKLLEKKIKSNILIDL